MITSKNLPWIVFIFVSIALALCGLMFYTANAFERTAEPEYQKRLFGETVISLELKVNPDDWQALLDNAQAKEWISGDLIINGEQFSTVGIRTKGNSSLTTVARSESDRYSLQIKFNKYVKGQTYYGLDTFCINNLMGDATYMKDLLSYEIMDFAGVTTPLTNYANVTVNGEGYGFFIALERYDKAFLDRVYGTSAGQLYNVKLSMGIPNGQEGGHGPGGGSSGGGSLVYTDDELTSYASIFENNVFNKVTDAEKQRVVTALKNLAEGTNLEKYFDVDQVLRYFAAHTVVVNLDSYISNMQQNYYLYEHNGKITILPWDYNLAFGGFQSGNASSVINFPIDTPVSGVNMEDRPLLSVLLAVEEYKELYHQYLSEIVEGYFESGLFERSIATLDEKISSYVQADVSAFYSYEQYKEALPNLLVWGELRAKSIKGQLAGAIPSTTASQNVNRSALVDTSSLNLAALGSMMGGDMGGEKNWNMDQNVGRGAERGRIGERGGAGFGELPEPPESFELFGGFRPGAERSDIEIPNMEFSDREIPAFGAGGNQPPDWDSRFSEAQGASTGNVDQEYVLLVVLLLVLVVVTTAVIARPKKDVV